MFTSYKPHKMIKKSRFRDFFAFLSNKQKNELFIKMDKLIIENKEYVDKQNYGYLCNLFTSLALVQLMIEEGKNKDEAEQIVLNAMYDYLMPSVKTMQSLAKHKWFVPLLKKYMPKKIKHTCGYGWKITFPKTNKDCFTMITHKCIFAEIFNKYGYPKMTKGFCQVDNLLYDALPNTTFTYAERIGEGGKVCDYSFIRKNK